MNSVILLCCLVPWKVVFILTSNDKLISGSFA